MKEKTRVMLVTTLLVSVAMMMIGCERGGSDSPAPGTKAAGTTVTGGVLGAIRFDVDGKRYSTAGYFGTYDPAEDRTGFTGGRDGEGGWNLSFSVEGKGTGSFKASAVMMFETFRAFHTEDVAVTITSYGDVRENIEGTFSGTLVSLSDPDNTMTITDGRLSAWRTPF